MQVGSGSFITKDKAANRMGKLAMLRKQRIQNRISNLPRRFSTLGKSEHFNAVRLTAKRIPKRADLAGVCGRKWVVSI
jgi:hypothetical protein